MRTKGSILISMGLLLIAAALAVTVYNVRQSSKAELSAQSTVMQLAQVVEENRTNEDEPVRVESTPDSLPLVPDVLPDYRKNPEMDMPVCTIDGETYVGMLSIPALELTLPVGSEWSSRLLRLAPCRYSGSAYLGNIVICAHNYRGFFSRLKELNTGDQAYFTDVDGNVFSYQVVEKETLQPENVEEMTSGDWDMTLFTCTVGGQSRVTVRFSEIIN